MCPRSRGTVTEQRTRGKLVKKKLLAEGAEDRSLESSCYGLDSGLSFAFARKRAGERKK